MVFRLKVFKDYLCIYLEIFELFNLFELEEILRVSRDIFFYHSTLLTGFLLRQEWVLLLFKKLTDECGLEVKILTEFLCYDKVGWFLTSRYPFVGI